MFCSGGNKSSVCTLHEVTLTLLVFLGRLCTCFCFSLLGDSVKTCNLQTVISDTGFMFSVFVQVELGVGFS